ncbi:tubulin-tyrosine ligase family domain-containing protein [Ditylenchus destructor]|nr:tubulin-tyrosine ligase family domain-containing protein [Ditylenchus destructor]
MSLFLPRPFRHPTFISVLILFVGICLTSWNIRTLRLYTGHLQNGALDSEAKSKNDVQNVCQSFKQGHNSRPVAWINGKSKNNGYLKHVKRIFSLFGYEVKEGLQNADDPVKFDVLWNHEYPFSIPEVRSQIDKRGEQQRIIVNHVPGSGFYTSKVNLATCGLRKGVPKAFELPAKRKEFEEFARLHPNLLWVQKSNAHRGIKVKPVSELNLDEKGTFVQQFIENPLLIDGRKFDIGIYTVITSVSPLRVYIYFGDILLRFCPKNHEPFDAADLNKYVVEDDYTPVWEMPSLRKYYLDMNLSFKETFNAYLKEKLRKDPETIYLQIEDIIREVFLTQNENMRRSLRNYQPTTKFFELSRFDFVVDDDFNVFLMEANMSPNLSSEHFPQNRLLYEQVLLNLFSLIGIAGHAASTRLSSIRDIQDMNRQVTASDRDISVYSPRCELQECQTRTGCSEKPKHCGLCITCMSAELKESLRQAYMEQMDARTMKRIWPHNVKESENERNADDVKSLTESDAIQMEWFRQKCKIDNRFC